MHVTAHTAEILLSRRIANRNFALLVAVMRIRKKRFKENPEKYSYHYKRKCGRNKKGTDLGMINEIVRAEGITYGQYVARHGLN